jgi:hypothetical protein
MTHYPQAWAQRASQLHIEGRALIDARWHLPQDGATYACKSPIDGRTLTQVARCGSADVDLAVRQTPPFAEARCLSSGVREAKQAPRHDRSLCPAPAGATAGPAVPACVIAMPIATSTSAGATYHRNGSPNSADDSRTPKIGTRKR